MRLPNWCCGCARTRARSAPERSSISQAGGGPTDRAVSFDHLVGAGEERGRDREAKGLGGSVIHKSLELCRKLDRYLARWRASEDSVYKVSRSMPVRIQVDSVAD